MSKMFFISDVHFGLESRERERAKEERVLSFLDKVMDEASQLCIVGDLFDAWIEYRTVIPKGYHRILTKLEDLTRRGIVVHYLVGNHDFWIRDYFKQELGMITYHEPIAITVDGKRFFIHHGDGLATNDTGYRILKKVLRNPFNIWLFSWLHPDIGISLARSSSKSSRNYTSTKDYGEEDGMAALAAQKIAEGFDYVIMGHRHKPACKQIGKGTYINLGDWISYNTYAEFDGERLSLVTWQ